MGKFLKRCSLPRLSQEETDNNITYMWNLFFLMIQMKSLKNRNRLTDFENKLIVTKGDVGEKDKLGAWNEHTYTTIRKTDN